MSVGHRHGPIGTTLKAVLRYLIWRLEMSMRGRAFPLQRTKDRLMANLEHSTLESNVRERQRRAAKIVSWILHGAITTHEICEKVVKYEVRKGEERNVTGAPMRSWLLTQAVEGVR